MHQVCYRCHLIVTAILQDTYYCYFPHFMDDKEKSAQGYPLASGESGMHTPAAWAHLLNY